MSKTLKTILYVLLGLVGILLLVWAVFSIFGGYGVGMMRSDLWRTNPWMWDHMGTNNWPLRTIFFALLCLGLLLLVVLGIVALVIALVRGSRVSQTPPASQVTRPVKPCPNCGKLTQEDWKTCPYCGTPLV